MRGTASGTWMIGALVFASGLHLACDERATLGAIGQPTTEMPAPEANLELSDTDLDFGMVCTEHEATRTLTIANTGDAPATSLTSQFSTESSADFSTPYLDLRGSNADTLEPGGSLTIDFLYQPTGDDTDAGTWILSSGSQTWEVPLTAAEGGPELTVDPETPDFGAVQVGTAGDLTLELRNTGEFSLSVVQVDWIPGDLASDEEFLWVLPPDYPQVLESGEVLSLVLRYEPQAYAPPPDLPLGTIEISSNDCLVPVTAIPILGWPGGSETLCPPDPITTEVLYGKEAEATDVLFVVDNSESMGDEQIQLAENFSAFVSSATALGIDYRIGVTTTDMELGQGALIGNQTIVTPDNPDTFLDNVLVGTGGSTNEQGLAAAVASLSDPGKFLGALRPEAILVVIFVSDEPDNSPGTAGSYLTTLQQVKKSADRFIAHAIVGPPSEYGCETADFGPDYTYVAEESGGVTASICEPSFADALVAFGEASFAAKTRFYLAETAVPGSVSLTVDGVSCTVGWALDDTGKVVKFDPEAECLPDSGVEVAVTYEMVCVEENLE